MRLGIRFNVTRRSSAPGHPGWTIPGSRPMRDSLRPRDPHTAKTAMLPAGNWAPKYLERSQTHRGYRLPSLYAPIGLGATWAGVYEERRKAGDDPIQEKTYILTPLLRSIRLHPGGRAQQSCLSHLLDHNRV